MKLYTESDLIELVQSLKDYTSESHVILGHDEREAKEFVDIFLKDRTPLELPTDEEIEQYATFAFPDAEKIGGETYAAYRGMKSGAKWMKEQILNPKKEKQSGTNQPAF